MVTKEAVKVGVSNFFERECCMKASGVGKFTAYFMLPSINQMVDEYMYKLENSAMMGDIFVDGYVDVDKLEVRAVDAMNKCGKLEVMGFMLDTGDIHELANYIRKAVA